jgi:ADP-ribosylglycohydrolase
MSGQIAIGEHDRFMGAMFGLAYGDAIGFPALFHRFRATPAKRHDFLWRTNMELDRQHITRLTLPYTHRLPSELLEPGPTDDTEFALLTLLALVEDKAEATQQTFLVPWQEKILPIAADVLSSFSERAAIENLKRGLLPPTTGSDNPLHYEDCAAIRAVPIGLYYVGDPDRAARLAILDAQITQAEDGIYAASAMAAAISILAAGGTVSEATQRARQEFPTGSWISHVDLIAQDCVREAETVDTLPLLLSRRVINTVYSYGSLAPETIPAALAIIEKCAGDLQSACLHANVIAKSADSLPALAGALCGAYQGIGAISPQWRKALATCRGLCLPFLANANLEEHTNRLFERAQRNRNYRTHGETSRISE